MARGARQHIERLSIYEESPLGTANLATIQHLGGISEIAHSEAQDQFEDTSQRDDRNAKRAPWKGEYKNTLGYKAPHSKQLVTQLGSVFKSALGTEQAQAALVVTLGGVTLTSFPYTGGEPDQWVIVQHFGGRLSYRPVVRKTGGVAFFGFQLPTIAGGIVAIVNAKDFGALSGRCYFETPGADMVALGAQLDRHSEPDQVKVTHSAQVPTSLLWEMAPGSRKMVTVGMEGRGWIKNAAPNILASTKPVKHSPSWQTDIYLLTDFDAPAAAPAVTKALSYKVQFAPKWLNLESTQARGGATEASLPQYSLTEWRRDDPMQEDIEIVIAFADNAHNVNFDNEVDYHIAIIDYLGNPGSSNFVGDAICTYIPKARLKAAPEITGNNGVDGMRLLFHGADERAAGDVVGQMSSALLTKLAFAQFIA